MPAVTVDSTTLTPTATEASLPGPSFLALAATFTVWSALAVTLTSLVVVIFALPMLTTASVSAMATATAKPFRPLGLDNTRTFEVASTIRLSASITVGSVAEVPMLTCVVALTYATLAPLAKLSNFFRTPFCAASTPLPSNCPIELSP